MKNRKVRWGILGAGEIAKKFCAAMPYTKDSELVAVASRTAGKAVSFASSCGVLDVATYENYEALLARDDIDVVYIASINTKHYEDTLLALELGKNVLVEKPFALNAKQCRSMIEKAQEKGLFLMEAMWSRFNPVNLQVRELVRSGRIGKVERIEADFGYFGGEDKLARHLNRDLGGGSLLDVGIYPLSFNSFMLGRVPSYTNSCAALDPDTGVDRQFTGLALDETACLHVSSASVVNQLSNAARIYGSKGAIKIPVFFNPKEASVVAFGADQEASFELIEKISNITAANGYQYEIDEVARLLKEQKTESEIMPLAESLRLMQEMDAMREAWGLRYPGED